MQAAPTGTVCPNWGLKTHPGVWARCSSLFLLRPSVSSSSQLLVHPARAIQQGGQCKHFHKHCPWCTCCRDTQTSASPSQQASQDSHSHQHKPPSSHHPRLFHSTKINSFIRTFNSIFPAEEEHAWRLLLKAALFSAQVAIYLLDDEQEKETSMYNSSLEQHVSLFCMQTTAEHSQEVLLKPQWGRKPTSSDSRTQQISKKNPLVGHRGLAVHRHFSHPPTLMNDSRPTRQHKPWEHLQGSTHQQHFFWNKANIKLF